MDIIKELWYGNVAPFEQCTRGDIRCVDGLKGKGKGLPDGSPWFIILNYLKCKYHGYK